MPNLFQTASAKNKIESPAGNNLQEELSAILDGNAVVEEPAPAPAAKQTEEFTNPTPTTSTGSTNKKSGVFTPQTHAGIGKFRQLTQERNAAIDEITRRAYDEVASQVRIVGYCSGYDSKIDFKKTTTRTEGNGDATVSFALNMYRPRKPDRVIVRYPIDLVAQIQRSKNNGLSSSDIKDATALAGGENGSAVKILKFSKKEHELYDWIQKFMGRMYIQEAEEIFEPAYRFKNKGQTCEEYSSYTGYPAYAATGGTPGLLVKVGVTATKVAKTDKGNEFTIDMTAPEARELTVSYSNTGRPTWITPHNTIYDKKFATIEGGPHPENANEMSLAYFKRFYDDTFNLAQSNADKAKNIAMTPAGEIANGITGNTRETFVSTVFTDGSFWTNATVEDWYEVVKDGTGYHKKVLSGNQLRIVKRIGKTSKDGSKVTYSNVTIPLTETGGEYSWEDAVTPQIEKALHGAKLTFDMYMAAATKSARTNTDKAKSRTFIPVEVPGLTIDELVNMMNASFGGTGDYV